jgi:hypothetical protein
MLIISEILGKTNAILHSDGSKVYNEIIGLISESKKIDISFSGITHCTTSFLNASIGKVWMNNPDQNHDIFRFFDASPSLLEKIDLVRDNALNRKKKENRDSAAREFLEDAY